MPKFKVNGVELSYEDRGSGETVLFLHGLLWGGWMFEPQMKAMEARFRCLAVDFRGQGGSQVTETGYDMETLTSDILSVIEALKLAPVHLVGLSMGGFVAMRIAARRPELVRSLVLLGTSADPEPPENVTRYKRLNVIARWVGLSPVAGKVMPIMFGKTILADPARAAELSEYRRKLLANHKIGITRAVVGVITRQGITAELGKIACPTLILVGDEDQATRPERAERIKLGIIGSRLSVIKGAGHTSSLEQPAAVNAEILRFHDGLAHRSNRGREPAKKTAPGG